MKRIIAAIALVSLAFTFSFAQEGNPFKLGALVLTSINDASSGYSEMDKNLGIGMGFGAGLAASIPLGSQLSVNPELNFLYRRLFNYESSGEERGVKVETNSYVSEFALSVPVMVQFRPVSDVGAYISAGLQLDIPFSSTQTQEIKVGGTDYCPAMKLAGEDCEGKFKDRSAMDFGIAFGAGYMVNENIGVDARAVIGITKPTKDEEEDLGNGMKVTIKSKSSLNQYAARVLYFF